MKLKIANYISAVILTVLSITGISAQETKSKELKTFPAQFSIFYPLATHGERSTDYTFNFSLNLLYGKIGGLNGMEASGLVGMVEGDVNGAQIAGIGNGAGNIKGIQAGGLLNGSGNMNGMQVGGLLNAGGDIKGIQTGGLFNVANNMKGIQVSGITNMAKKTEGVQIAGLGNISKEISGVSIGGVFNLTEKLQGVLFGGVINVIDTVESGVSIALINIVRKGFYDEWALTFSDYQNVGLNYKMGMQKFYTIFSAGANFKEDNLWVFGIGFGNRTALSRRIDFQPEIIAYQYFPTDFRKVQNTTASHLKIGFVYNLNDKLGIAVAPSIYHLYNDLSKNQEKYNISPFSPFYKDENTKRIHSIGAGISVGLSLR